MLNEREIHNKAINTLRFLAVDGVQQANSGHPGLPMGAAVMAYTIWTRHLKHNPATDSSSPVGMVQCFYMRYCT
jgi:transketolase